MPYIPGLPPASSDVEQQIAALREEVRRLSESISALTSVELKTVYVEPTRPRSGMIVHADGTSWDPGSGQGLYVYQGGAWEYLVGGTTAFNAEDARDAIGTALVAGAGITVTVNDPADTITVAGTVTQYTDELAQDAVGTILVDSTEIDFTYSDATPSITASIVAGSIDETKLDASTNASLDLADSASQPGHTHTSSSVTDFTEAAQDAVGAMALDGNIVELNYDDAVPSLTPYIDRDAWLIRETLSAARTYYVRTDGSDSNTGLVDSAGGAFLTIQKAADTALTLNFNGQAVTIQVRDGTFAEAVTIRGPIIGLGSLTVTGNTTTPANCVISPATGAAFALSNGVVASIGGFKFVSTNSYGVFAGTNSTLTVSGACEFGACSVAHIGANARARVVRAASCTVTGAAARHLYAVLSGSIEGVAGTVVTITGTPAFSTAFVEMNRGSNYYEGNGASAYSGAATGFKFLIDADCSLRSTTSVANMNDILPGAALGVFRPLQGVPNRPFRNLLYNASGRLRDGPSGAVGDDAYGLHNRWYVLSQSGNVTPSAIDDAANGVPSLMRLTNSHGSSQRIGYAQILPGHVSRPLRGKRLWGHWTGRLSNTLTIRMAVLSWSGTEDVLASDIVNTWTSTTYTVGNFFTNPAGLSVLKSISAAFTAVDTLESKVSSTFFADVPSDCNNLIFFMHTSSAIAASATFDFRAQLEEGAQNTEFDQRLLELEKMLCSPFYQKKTVRSENGDRHIPFLPMQAVPTVTVSAGTANYITIDGFELNNTAAASVDIIASAEL